MVGIQLDIEAIVSKFTLAYLKDTNWYAFIDMDYADDISWGKNRGCEFV